VRPGRADQWVNLDDLCPIDHFSENMYREFLDNRGGCRCCISPPCYACSEPIEIEELNNLGFPTMTDSRGTFVYLGDPDEVEEPDMTPSNIVPRERIRR